MDEDKSIVKTPKDTKALTYKKQRLNSAIATYKKKGFYVPSFENLDNANQLHWLYHYFTNGFNGMQAYRAAGYKGKKGSQSQCACYLKNRTATQISELLQDVAIDNDLEVDLIRMGNVDLADYEDFTTGKKTLKELRAEGIDTTPIKSVIKGFDRDGQPYAKIDIESGAAIKQKLLKLKRQANDEINKQINIAEQTINIITSVPSYHDRVKFNKIDIIEAEVEDEEDIIDNTDDVIDIEEEENDEDDD